MEQDRVNIQWYPGHMTKTRRQIEADLKLVDAVCEIVDARIPIASRNPDIDSICGNKPRIVILNRMDLADPEATKRWMAYFRSKGMAAVATDCKSRKGINDFKPAVQALLHEKVARFAAKGMTKALRVMVVGIPNVGLLLAYTGAVKENVIDMEDLASRLMALLWQRYPDAIRARYGIEEPEESTGFLGYDLLIEAGRKRGFLMARGEINTERMAKVLIDEFRSGKLGCFTLEEPEDAQ